MCRVTVTTAMTANKSGFSARRFSAAGLPRILPDRFWFCHTHANSGFMLSDMILFMCGLPVSEPSRLTLTGLKFGFRVPAGVTQQRLAAQRSYSLHFHHLLDDIIAYSCGQLFENYTPLLAFNAWVKNRGIRAGEAPERSGEERRRERR